MYICIYVYVYIYIYIHKKQSYEYLLQALAPQDLDATEEEVEVLGVVHLADGLDEACVTAAANLPTNIADFRGLDSSTILIFRGGHIMFIGDFLESLSRAMLVGTMLVGRLGM